MADVIHKYQLNLSYQQKVKMREGAKILSVGVQKGEVMVWVEESLDAEYVHRHIYGVVTGQGLPAFERKTYIGTVLLAEDTFVFHLYDAGELPLPPVQNV